MKPICYRRWFLRIGEFWFQGNGGLPDSDIIRYMHVERPVEGARCEQWHTLMIALSKDEAEIFKGMDEGTRYEIRRAQTKDDLSYSYLCVASMDDMHEFIAAYERAARANDALPQINAQRLSLMARAGLLDLSLVRDREGRTLTWHVHVIAAGTVRQFYSLSAFSTYADQQSRRMCGRANKLHHWLDMLRFREAGCDKYDFGGICRETTDAKKAQISRFKAGFGGEEATTYNCVYPRTVMGRIALAGWRVLGQPRTSKEYDIPPVALR